MKKFITYLFFLFNFLFCYAQKSQTGTYTVTSEKAYFHNQADVNTIRKGYVLRNDEVQVQKSQGKYVYAIYTSTTGKQTKGWLLLNNLSPKTTTTKQKLPFVGTKQAYMRSGMGYLVTIKADGIVTIRFNAGQIIGDGGESIIYNGKYSKIIKVDDTNYKIENDKISIVDENGVVEKGCSGIENEIYEYKF
ncbi:MAG: hypothetical protein U0T07_09535 [Chitinophagales bacterium]